MPSQVFHQLYYHVTWSVKGRRSAITAEMRQQVELAVEEHARAKGAVPVACSAMPDHVHLVLCLPPTACLEALVRAMKGSTATELNRERGAREPLWWDPDYGAVTIRKGELDRVVAYVAGQVEIHAGHQASRTLEAASQSHYEALGASPAPEQADPSQAAQAAGPAQGPELVRPEAGAPPVQPGAEPPASQVRPPRAGKNGAESRPQPVDPEAQHP